MAENDATDAPAKPPKAMPFSKHAAKLDEMLKAKSKELDSLAEAFEEIAKEQSEERKKVAKDLIKQALELVDQLKRLGRDFEGAYKKTDKQLGKIMSRIASYNKGGSGEPEPEEEKDEKEKSDD